MSNFFAKKGSIFFLFFVTCIMVFLSMKYFVPLFMPFILAFLFVTTIYSKLCFLSSHTKIGKGFWAAAILIFFFILLGGLLWYAGGRIFQNLGGLVEQMNQVQNMFCLFIRDCCDNMEAKLGIGSKEMEVYVLERVNILVENMQMEIAPKVMGESVIYVKSLFAFIAASAISFISVILLAKDYEKIKALIWKKKEFREAAEIFEKIIKLCGVFLKAQMVILFFTSTVCTLGFLILKVPNSLGLGVLTGFLDMLPFIGTGIILIPLALFSLLKGNFLYALGYVVLYIMCICVREFLEPKLIGKKMGILPIGILMAIYIGVKLYGLIGIILGPISVLLIIEIMKKIKTIAFPEKVG